MEQIDVTEQALTWIVPIVPYTWEPAEWTLRRKPTHSDGMPFDEFFNVEEETTHILGIRNQTYFFRREHETNWQRNGYWAHWQGDKEDRAIAPIVRRVFAFV